MKKEKIIIGCRNSKLAIIYAQKVKEKILDNSDFHPDKVVIRGIVTRGDQVQDRRLSDVGGKGLFSKNIEKELEKEAYRFRDFIKHSIEGKILGPVNAPIFRLKRKFRVRLLIRAAKSLKVQNSLQKNIQKFKLSAGMKLTVDVDPINFN